MVAPYAYTGRLGASLTKDAESTTITIPDVLVVKWFLPSNLALHNNEQRHKRCLPISAQVKVRSANWKGMYRTHTCTYQ